MSLPARLLYDFLMHPYLGTVSRNDWDIYFLKCVIVDLQWVKEFWSVFPLNETCYNLFKLDYWSYLLTLSRNQMKNAIPWGSNRRTVESTRQSHFNKILCANMFVSQLKGASLHLTRGFWYGHVCTLKDNKYKCKTLLARWLYLYCACRKEGVIMKLLTRNATEGLLLPLLR